MKLTKARMELADIVFLWIQSKQLQDQMKIERPKAVDIMRKHDVKSIEVAGHKLSLTCYTRLHIDVFKAIDCLTSAGLGHGEIQEILNKALNISPKSIMKYAQNLFPNPDDAHELDRLMAGESDILRSIDTVAFRKMKGVS